jgi:ELWxxDGT repeat protein
VLFRGSDKAGASGLWMTDGTALGTKELTGIVGAPSTGVNPTDITVFNGKALFNGVDTAGNLGLWTTDGTAQGTQELASIDGAATTGLNPTDLTVFNGEVLFNGADANGLSGLWMTDGTAGGTHELLAGTGGASTTAGLDPSDMTVFGSEILFSGLDSNGLTGLWVTDGTANGTHELLAKATGATAAKDPHGLSPTDLTIFNGKAFFSGLDQFGRHQLWETDGTAAGTQMLTVVGSNNAIGLNPLSLEVYNNQLLFQGLNAAGFTGLWTTNGTAAGTQEISPPASTTYKFGFAPSDLTALTTVTSNILWQNTSGQASIWQMNGSSLIGGGPVTPNPGPSFRAVGTGDLIRTALPISCGRTPAPGRPRSGK